MEQGEDLLQKLREEMNRQALQIEQDGNDPLKLTVHVQRINSHLRLNTQQLGSLQADYSMLKKRIDAIEDNQSSKETDMKELKCMVQKLTIAILGDEEFEHEGLLRAVKRHNKIINENLVKNSVFKTWVLPILIGVCTALASGIALKLIITQ